jgi:hypothetical protein
MWFLKEGFLLKQYKCLKKKRQRERDKKRRKGTILESESFLSIPFLFTALAVCPSSSSLSLVLGIMPVHE